MYYVISTDTLVQYLLKRFNVTTMFSYIDHWNFSYFLVTLYHLCDLLHKLNHLLRYHQAIEESQEARLAGITLIVVQVGALGTDYILRIVASDPDEKNFIHVTETDQLMALVPALTSVINNGMYLYYMLSGYCIV